MRETLLQAISGYEVLVDHLGEAQRIMTNASPEDLLELQERLLNQRERVETCDARLEELNSKRNIIDEPDLIERLRELMAEAQHRNRLISERLGAMMAVVQSELSDLQAGRTAVRGYQGRRSERGNRVNGAF